MINISIEIYLRDSPFEFALFLQLKFMVMGNLPENLFHPLLY